LRQYRIVGLTKTPNLFTAAATLAISFFSEQPAHSFHSSTARQPFVSTSPPLQRRYTAAAPPPREVVSGPPLHLLLLRATITTLQVRRSFRLHRRCTATSPSTRLFRRRCIFVFSEHEVRRHQIWCFMGCFTRISYWLGLLIAFIY